MIKSYRWLFSLAVVVSIKDFSRQHLFNMLFI